MMQTMTTLTSVAAGLFFSVACGVLIEEFLFGALFHVLAKVTPKPKPEPVRTARQ